MKDPVSLEEFVEKVKQKKAELGITDEMIAAARNSGWNRSKEKRELLARIQERCKNLDIDPYPANF